MTTDTTNNDNDPPAAESSSERRFYDSLFPASRVVVQVNQIGVNFEALRSLFPERVLLNRLDGIFQAWEQGHATLPDHLKVSVTNLPNGGVGPNRVVLYDYDNYTYRSTVLFTHYHQCPRIEIKLSNDGFIYPPRRELALDPSYQRRNVHHQRTNWVRLTDDTVRVHFPSILKGVKTILNMQPQDRIYGKVLYHEFDERVDFLFVNDGANPSFGVLVAFEPGHPEHYHQNDAWGEF